MAAHKFIISDESENKHGFVFLNSELDFSIFNKNPVCLFMHSLGSVVLGMWSEPKLEKIGSKECWTAELTFDSEDEDVKKIEGKVQRGFLKAVSLGAIVKGGFEKKGRTIFARNGQVHEISLVTIGSNASAVKLHHPNGELMQDTEVKLCLNTDNQNNNNNMTELKDVAVTLGLSDTATAAEITSSIVNLKAEIGYKQKFEDLEKTVSDGKKKAFADAVELKIAQKALSATDKQDYIDLYELSAEKACIMLSKLTAPKDLMEVAGAKSGDVVSLSVEYDNLEKVNGLITLMGENPTHFNALYKAKFGVEPSK